MKNNTFPKSRYTTRGTKWKWNLLILGGVCAGVVIAQYATRAIAPLRFRTANPVVAQFSDLFPNSTHTVLRDEHASNAVTGWRSKATLHGRYILELMIPIHQDWLTGQYLSRGVPVFYLDEVASIQPSMVAGRVAQTIIYGQHVQFGARQWEALCRANGDIAVLGIDVTIGMPVAGVDELDK